MTNLERYNKVLMEVFGVSKEALNASFTYQERPDWDSVNQMRLIAALEEEFDIMIDVEDIFDLLSYDEGKRILAKYGISCE